MTPETTVPCGEAHHAIRLAPDGLELVDHPDAESELILAALGGGKPNCIRIAEAWTRRVQDIDLLMVLPRSDEDEVRVTWGDVEVARSPVRTSVAMSGPPGPPVPIPAGLPAHIRQMQATLQEAQARQLDILTVLALGHEFQKRLVGTIVASAGEASPGEASPALAAALAGRAAPAIARWLDVDPDNVTIAVHKGKGWGSMFASDDAVWVALPVSWLSDVWACGMEIVDGRFVVGVGSAGVVAVGAPGSET
jgi:hypothetical protein